MKVQNNSLAMIGTVCFVGIFASILGFFDPNTCTVEQLDNWTSCESIARDRQMGSWALLIVSVAGFVFSLVRTRAKR